MNTVRVGVDVVELERFRTVLERRPRLLERIFTEKERAYALRALGTHQVSQRTSQQASKLSRTTVARFGARFAAKEATLKALGVGLGKCRLAEIEVTKKPSGAPGISLHGAAALLAEKAGIEDLELSMTHGHLVAVAVVTALVAAPSASKDASRQRPARGPAAVASPLPGQAGTAGQPRDTRRS
jgi:holo-[acyl-carrier protein] synthase